MKTKFTHSTISKRLLTIGIVGSLFLSSGMAYAVGNIVVTSNTTVVKAGEELGMSLGFIGDGNYDVYVGITGTGDIFKIFDENFTANEDFITFNANSELVLWKPPALPAKFRDNITLGNLTKIDLFPRKPLDEYAGNYSVYAVLTKPGQFDLNDLTTVIDGPFNVEIQKEGE